MPRTLFEVLNEANPNKIADALGDLPIGNAIARLPRFVRATITGQVATLPEFARADRILRVYCTAGSIGEKTVVANGATPTTGEVAVNLNGNIAFGDAGATAAEITYVSLEGEVVTETLPVAASSMPLVVGDFGALLLSVNVDVGLVLGAKTILARNAAPSAGQASLNAAGTAVTFNATDVVTGRATVRYVKRPKITIAQALATTVAY